jgi:hypothetical protein
MGENNTGSLRGSGESTARLHLRASTEQPATSTPPIETKQLTAVNRSVEGLRAELDAEVAAVAKLRDKIASTLLLTMKEELAQEKVCTLHPCLSSKYRFICGGEWRLPQKHWRRRSARCRATNTAGYNCQGEIYFNIVRLFAAYHAQSVALLRCQEFCTS